LKVTQIGTQGYAAKESIRGGDAGSTPVRTGERGSLVEFASAGAATGMASRSPTCLEVCGTVNGQEICGGPAYVYAGATVRNHQGQSETAQNADAYVSNSGKVVVVVIVAGIAGAVLHTTLSDGTKLILDGALAKCWAIFIYVGTVSLLSWLKGHA
jgi:hypothetical protein